MMRRRDVCQKPWLPFEDQVLMAGIDVFGTRWIEIERYLPQRSMSSIRNRFQRIRHGNKMRELGISLKNTCVRCGKFRLGHVCEISAPHLKPGNFTTFAKFADAVRTFAEANGEVHPLSNPEDEEEEGGEGEEEGEEEEEEEEGEEEEQEQEDEQEDELEQITVQEICEFEGFETETESNHSSSSSLSLEKELQQLSADMAYEFATHLFSVHPHILNPDPRSNPMQHESFVRESAREWFREQHSRFLNL